MSFRSKLAVRRLIFESDVVGSPYFSRGTCFIAKLGNHMYVVTAWHVLGQDPAHVLSMGACLVMPNYDCVDALPFDLYSTSGPEWAATEEGSSSSNLETALDIGWARVRRSQVDPNWFRDVLIFDLGASIPLQHISPGDRLTLLGYATHGGRSQHVDYDSRRIDLTLHSANGVVSRDLSFDGCFRLVDTTSTSSTFDGFSGGPVFAGAEANARLAGMAVLGSASSGIIHVVAVNSIVQIISAVNTEFPEEIATARKHNVNLDIPIW